MINKLNQLFTQSTEKIKQAVHPQLLRKNKINIKVKTLSKTTILTIVALVGSAIFSISLASWVTYGI